MELDSSEKFNKMHDKPDQKISIALMSAFIILTIQYFVLIYFNLLGTSIGSSIQLFSKGLAGLAYLYAAPSVFKRSLKKFLEIYFIAVFIFLLHYAIFPENRQHVTSLLFPFFFVSLPALLYTLSIRDFQVFKKIMGKAAYIVFVVGLFLGLLIFSGRASIGTYSMVLSYYMLLPIVMFLDELLDKFSIQILVFTILSLLIILALGSRGAILCIVIFLLLKFIKPNSKRTYKRVIGHFSLLGIGLIALIFLEQIMRALYDFLLQFGITSRTLILFLQDGVHLSGRDRIYEKVMAEILQSPIIGIGIAGDTRIIGSSYAHNFFIEVIGNFGVVLGLLLCIGIILLIVKSLLTKDRDKYNLAIIWLSLGFAHLMVSSSYLIDIKFWIFLGFIIKFTKIKWRKREKNGTSCKCMLYNV